MTIKNPKTHFPLDAKVSWPWGDANPEGVIDTIFTKSVTKVLQGSKVTRHGTTEDPAYLIVQKNGHFVLKLGHELKPEK